MTPLPLPQVRNGQPVEKPAEGDGEHVEVVDVFDTIQGEGPYQGEPAVFVRLAGCNLQCPGCDTNYTEARRRRSVDDIVGECLQLASARPRYQHKKRLVVITGGEPFRQPLGALARRLMASHFTVQVETNGTLYQADFPWFGALTIVCSPKAGSVHPLLRFHVRDLKYVLRAGAVDEADGLPTSILGAVAPARPWSAFLGTVWVQPEDEGDETRNKLNLQAAVESARKYGHRLGLQLHKTLGLP